MTYLEAINFLLSKVGTREVASEDVQHPDVVSAKSTLNQHVSQFLDRGWWFNHRKSVTHEPDSSGYINLGTNVLRIESSDETRRDFPNLALHGNRIYNVLDNTYTFEQSITIDEYIDVAWDNIPHTAQVYIRYKAAAEYVENKLEDVPKANRLEMQAREAWGDLNADEVRSTRPNMLDSPSARRMRAGVRPYNLRIN